MTIALIVGVLAAVIAPHSVDLDRARSSTAATIWFAALALRALAGLYVVLLVLLYVPTTQLFSLITHWCWHTVLPFLTQHIPLDGHMVGDAALIAPAFALATSLSWMLVGAWRGARAVRELTTRHGVGEGPEASLIIEERQVMLAAAGLRRPRVLVSAGALMTLEDDELAAGLAHERGHIARRHRYVLLAGQLLAALGRFVPGTRHALDELELHLERDADCFALRQHERLALASAICKTALSRRAAPAFALSLAGSRFNRRMALLLDEPQRPRHDGVARVLATVMVSLVVASALAVPSSAAAGLGEPTSGPSLEHCDG